MFENEPLQKVTAFITRYTEPNIDLLLLAHPYTGKQFPAGTVESGEDVAAAVGREVREETGLKDARIERYLGSKEQTLPEGFAAVVERTGVFARPDPLSFNWSRFPRGPLVELTGREDNGFVQVVYTEHDRSPAPTFVTMEITGWVPSTVLTHRIQRHFFHLVTTEPTPVRWRVHVDNHSFELFWAALHNLPALAPPHNKWLQFFRSGWSGTSETKAV